MERFNYKKCIRKMNQRIRMVTNQSNKYLREGDRKSYINNANKLDGMAQMKQIYLKYYGNEE